MSVPVLPDPWELYAGDATGLTILLEYSKGTPQNLTDYEDWRCQWRTTPGAAEAVNIFVDDSERAMGLIHLYIAPEQTATDTGSIRSGVWDVQATLGGEPRTFLRGTTTWRKDVTR